MAGVDYVATNGVLTFADGQASTNVTITILNPNIVENSKTFNFALSNPVSAISTNCYLLAPSNAVITITNTVTSISFSSPTYSVSEWGCRRRLPWCERRDQYERERPVCDGGWNRTGRDQLLRHQRNAQLWPRRHFPDVCG